MRRRDRTLLPDDVLRDLAAIDAAIAGEPAEGDLAELAVAVRDERPRPGAGAIARLEERAEAGFAPRRAASGLSGRRRAVVPAFGVAGSLALATIVAVVMIDGGGGARPVESVAGTGDRVTATLDAAARAVRPSGRPALPSAVLTAPASAEAATQDIATAPAFPQTATAPAPARSVERGATLSLVTAPARLDDVASGVVRTTDGLGGYVVSSSVESRGAAGGSATFDLRVPAARLQTALARLSKLAPVRSRTESAFDVTGRVVAARGRVDALTAERRGVMRQLAAATTPAETARARERLRVLDVRLGRAKAAREELRRRTAYSTIGVDVATKRPAAGAGSGTWTPGDALRDALRVLSVALGAALVALAVLVPAGVVAAAIWGVWRVTRARRRRSALDGAR